MIIKSPAFENNESIPPRYTCDGENVSPPIEFYDVPEDVDSLVLIVSDSDAPGGTYYHWVMWNINPHFDGIGEGSIVEGAMVGLSSAGKKGYDGPCPPKGSHHYHFDLYGITGNILMPEDSKPEEIVESLNNKILAQARLFGVYERSSNESV